MTDPLLESFEAFLDRAIPRPGLSRHATVAGIRMHYLEWPGPPTPRPSCCCMGSSPTRTGGISSRRGWPSTTASSRRTSAAWATAGSRGLQRRPFHRRNRRRHRGARHRRLQRRRPQLRRARLLYARRSRSDSSRAIVVDSRLGSQATRCADSTTNGARRSVIRSGVHPARFLLRPDEPAPAARCAHGPCLHPRGGRRLGVEVRRERHPPVPAGANARARTTYGLRDCTRRSISSTARKAAW